MFDTEKDTVIKSHNATFAMIDIKRRNKSNSNNWTDEQRAEAQEFYTEVQASFEWSRVFSPNYRAKFISIKVENAHKQDLMSSRVRELIASAQSKGYTVNRLGKHVVFHLFEK